MKKIGWGDIEIRRGKRASGQTPSEEAEEGESITAVNPAFYDPTRPEIPHDERSGQVYLDSFQI